MYNIKKLYIIHKNTSKVLIMYLIKNIVPGDLETWYFCLGFVLIISVKSLFLAGSEFGYVEVSRVKLGYL